MLRFFLWDQGGWTALLAFGAFPLLQRLLDQGLVALTPGGLSLWALNNPVGVVLALGASLGLYSGWRDRRAREILKPSDTQLLRQIHERSPEVVQDGDGWRTVDSPISATDLDRLMEHGFVYVNESYMGREVRLTDRGAKVIR